MNKVGFYGKIPSYGDFVGDLPYDFVRPWDEWLQKSMIKAQESHQDQWREIYFNSPTWRFYLAPGVCGRSAWFGVIVPSQDKAGRCFPMTLADRYTNTRFDIKYFDKPELNTWFNVIEKSALDLRDSKLSLKKFEVASPQLLQTKVSNSIFGFLKQKRSCSYFSSVDNNLNSPQPLTKINLWHNN